jgi:hypothetical protein
MWIVFPPHPQPTYDGKDDVGYRLRLLLAHFVVSALQGQARHLLKS